MKIKMSHCITDTIQDVVYICSQISLLTLIRVEFVFETAGKIADKNTCSESQNIGDKLRAELSVLNPFSKTPQSNGTPSPRMKE